MGGSASGGLSRIGDDLLEALARLASGWSLGAAAAPPPERAWESGPHQLGKGGRRLLERASPKKGGLTGPNPTDRGKAGSKHHLIVEAEGKPLAESLSGANLHDTHELIPLLDAIPPIKQPRGAPRSHPKKVHADKAYASRKNRRELRRRNIVPRIARPGAESKEHLGRWRWVVERTLALLHQFRRLQHRYERREDIHFAFLVLGCSLLLSRTALEPFC